MSTTPLGNEPLGDAVEAEIHAEGEKRVAGRSPRQLAIARFKKDRSSQVAGAFVLLFILIALLAPVLTAIGVLDPYSGNVDLVDIDAGGIPKGAFGGISGDHWLGLEPGRGRDLLSRILLGISTSLTVALLATILTVIIGTVLGIIAGASGGWVDAVIGRIIDLTLSFPQTLMLLALSGGALIWLTGLGMNRDLAAGFYLILVLSIFGWPIFARLVRGQVLSLREREFVDAARVLGASRWRIYFKEMLPNLWAPILVYFTLTLPQYVSAEAALSFLGVGIKPPTPTLGNILRNSVAYNTADPVFFFAPAVFLATLVVSFNLFGDGIRDALDPKSDR